MFNLFTVLSFDNSERTNHIRVRRLRDKDNLCILQSTYIQVSDFHTHNWAQWAE